VIQVKEAEAEHQAKQDAREHARVQLNEVTEQVKTLMAEIEREEGPLMGTLVDGSDHPRPQARNRRRIRDETADINIRTSAKRPRVSRKRTK
jgi:hypothetical protein